MGDIERAVLKIAALPDSQDLRRTKREWVYFVRATEGQGLIKIGRAYQLRKRLMGLQNVVPVPIKLIGIINAPRGTEFVAHEAWGCCRTHGEWFSPTEQLLEFISALPKPAKFDLSDVRSVFSALGVDDLTMKRHLLSGLRRKNRKRSRRRAA
jgi:hypothetical protein